MIFYVSPADNPFTNYPLISAITGYEEIPYFPMKYLVFDGHLLSASIPRHLHRIKLFGGLYYKQRPLPGVFL
jgi:hypothetical protein